MIPEDWLRSGVFGTDVGAYLFEVVFHVGGIFVTFGLAVFFSLANFILFLERDKALVKGKMGIAR